MEMSALPVYDSTSSVSYLTDSLLEQFIVEIVLLAVQSSDEPLPTSSA